MYQKVVGSIPGQDVYVGFGAHLEDTSYVDSSLSVRSKNIYPQMRI